MSNSVASMDLFNKFHPVLRCVYQTFDFEKMLILQDWFPSPLYRTIKVALPILCQMAAILLLIEFRSQEKRLIYPVGLSVVLGCYILWKKTLVFPEVWVTPADFLYNIEAIKFKNKIQDTDIFWLANRYHDLEQWYVKPYGPLFNTDYWICALGVAILSISLYAKVKQKHHFQISVLPYVMAAGFFTVIFSLYGIFKSPNMTEGIWRLKNRMDLCKTITASCSK